MTDKELTVIVQTLAPIIQEHVTKAVSDSQTRMAVLEAQLKTIGDVRDKVVALEVKAAIPVPVLESKHNGPTATDVELAITKALAPVSERLAVVETRAPIPGPAGQDGAPGTHGTAGADGLGFDDMAVDFDGDRTLVLKFMHGERVKSFPITLPYLRYQGVFTDGKSYSMGDTSTWAGSLWHCNEDTTTKPGDGSKAWTLIVKRGRDGKDGVNGVDLHPVVKAS